MPNFAFHPPGINNLLGRIESHMVGCVMNTTSVGHCLQKMFLFVFEDCRIFLMIKRSQSTLPTRFPMVITAVLESLKVSCQNSANSLKGYWADKRRPSRRL